jgi:hypothetical protein
MAQKYNLINELAKVDERFTKPTDYLSLLGNSSLSISQNTSAQRISMLSKHIVQSLTLVNPDFPHMYTGAENVYGKYSNYHTDFDHNVKVVKIFKAYKHCKHSTRAEYIIQHSDTGEYDVIHRYEVEDLTENFGFKYNNDFIDELEEGEVIKKNVNIRSTTGYDEYGNHGFGVNFTTLISFNPTLTEDASVISQSAAKKLAHVKVNEITLLLNQDDVLINMYGDDNKYKGLPDIGEYVKGDTLCAIRHIRSNAFVDVREKELQRVDVMNDTQYYVKGKVVDIDIYSNNPEFSNNYVNSQLYGYYADKIQYYRDIYVYCQGLVNKGMKMSLNLKILHKRATDMLDKGCSWVLYDGSVFKNLMIKITVVEDADISIGSKITGRFGDKGVVSKIRDKTKEDYIEEYTQDYIVIDDKLMPRIGGPDGPPVDYMINALSIFNRNIPFVLDEQSINGVCGKLQKYIKTLSTHKEKVDVILDVLKCLNADQGRDMENIYNKGNVKEKENFVKSIETDGFYIQMQPFKNTNRVHIAMSYIYDKYGDILQPDEVWVWNKFRGEWNVAQEKSYVGTRYFMLLKQSADKGFSARGSGSINAESLPTKTRSKNDHISRFSNKAIRIGEYDIHTLFQGIKVNDFVLFNLLNRTSPEGRRWLTDHLLNDKKQLPKVLKNQAVKINAVYFKSLGIEIEHYIEPDEIMTSDHEEISSYDLNHVTIICSEKDIYYLKKIAHQYLKEKKKDDTLPEDEIWEKTFKHVHIWEDISPELEALAKLHIEDLICLIKR